MYHRGCFLKQSYLIGKKKEIYHETEFSLYTLYNNWHGNVNVAIILNKYTGVHKQVHVPLFLHFSDVITETNGKLFFRRGSFNVMPLRFLRLSVLLKLGFHDLCESSFLFKFKCFLRNEVIKPVLLSEFLRRNASKHDWKIFYFT